MDWNDFDARWRERHQDAVLDALEEVLKSTPSGEDYDAEWRWARLCHFRAMQTEEADDSRAAARFYTECETYARRATARVPERVEGRFWLGVGALEAARQKNKVALLRVLPRAIGHLEHAVKTDGAFHFAGALRVRARIAHLAPSVFGGGLQHALRLYRRALDIAPDNSTTLLYFAAALKSDRQSENAQAVLQRLLDLPDDPDWRWEQARDRRLARAQL